MPVPDNVRFEWNILKNAYIELYNKTVRYDWLANYLFDKIEEVQEFATRWLGSYKHERQYMAISSITSTQILAIILTKFSGEIHE